MTETQPTQQVDRQDARPDWQPPTVFQFSAPFGDVPADGGQAAQVESAVALAPTGTVSGLPSSRSQIVTCPECGARSTATMNRRDADDFCRGCDYPLFWVPGVVVRDDTVTAAESLRRLPGTVGRGQAAATACPHCAEPNIVSATTCARCGLAMHVAPAPLPPAPVAAAPLPEPVEVVEPQEHTPWWVWLLLALAVVGAVAVGIALLV